jgi:hypothetical protein
MVQAHSIVSLLTNGPYCITEQTMTIKNYLLSSLLEGFLLPSWWVTKLFFIVDS